MSYTPQLQDRDYYENLYDKRIITQCRMTEEVYEKAIQKEIMNTSGGKSEEQTRFEYLKVRDIYLYYQKGDLAIKREETIQKWMKEHREKDEFYYSTTIDVPYCIHCDRKMEQIIKQDYFSYNNTKKNRILFIFECKACKYRRGKWDNREEYIIERSKCEKCGSENSTNELLKNKKGTTFREICNDCGNIKDAFFKHYSSKVEKDPNYEKDRERFVLTSEKIYEFQRWLENVKKLHEMAEESKRKQQDEKEQGNESPDIPKIVNLDFFDMKERLTNLLKNEKYKDITFSNPSVFKKGVSVELTVIGRGIDEKAFLEIIKRSLENTNWKMNDKSILINLGILQCKLEGV